MCIKKCLKKIFGGKRPRPKVEIRTDEHGLKIFHGVDVRAVLHWSEVKKIIAYKYDVFTMDEICVGFFKAIDAEDWLEISENWPGFKNACETMKSVFPGIEQNWQMEVMFPPFERCETILWQEAGPQ